MNKDNNLTIKEVFELAVKNHSKNNLDLAKELYTKILEVNPNHFQSLNNLGVIFKKLKGFDDAISYFEKAILINPNYVDAHNNLGILSEELKKFQKARKHFEKVITVDPKNIYVLNSLGVIAKELGEFQKALNLFEKVIQIDPNFIHTNNNLGVIAMQLGEDQKAKKYFDKAIEVDANFFQAHNNLGLLFLGLGEFKKAQKHFEKVIEINPNNEEAYNNLSYVLQKLGEFQKALNCVQKSITINSSNYNSIESLQSILSNPAINNFLEKNIIDIKKLFLFLFKNNSVKHQNISFNTKSLIFTKKKIIQLQQIINKKTLLSNNIIQDLLKEELFHLLLQKTIIVDKKLEKFITKIRREILYKVNDIDKKFINNFFNFIISLSHNSWLNEYVNYVSKKEIDEINKLKNKIESNSQIDELDISILSTYYPIIKSNIIKNKLLNYKSKNSLFNDLITVQIKEPLREKELIKSINSLDIIEDPVSKKVQEQYEENPFPRWRSIDLIKSNNFFYWMNIDIKPNQINYNNKFDNPNVLIAGCGTGNHSIQSTKYKNANILAVDLSLSSLGYAKRKSEELGYKDIKYLHSDILQLKKLNKKFDIIECAGVLHHMKEPMKGLKILLDILNSHGFLKIGLYSEIARKHIIKTRELIKKKGLKNTTEEIKNFRQDILNNKLDNEIQKSVNFYDFYSMSGVRDLLFHFQEHRFTIPQISKILNDLNLEFLGFCFAKEEIKKKFSSMYPNDKKNISLDNWHKFEIKNPETFISMYQFWVKKK